ncbi:hypothetical protein KIN20_032272 [Parelaphostrongylus tenuis]|uniref:Uncharacterized protein n=1 Tax=Parelaphostrongylus tenuis TaxID=148309 RepID=A0AAD5WHX5_PARTN|nr:hypothetical protein KIN20_032272 [Parelaphostrongylus tenuis]
MGKKVLSIKGDKFISRWERKHKGRWPAVHSFAGTNNLQELQNNHYHKYMEEQRFHRTQVLKKGSQSMIDYHENFYTANVTFGSPGT